MYGIIIYNLNTVELASLYKQLANFQFQVHVQLAAGKVLLVIYLYVGSPTSLALHAHALSLFYHPSTLTRLPDTGSPFS